MLNTEYILHLIYFIEWDRIKFENQGKCEIFSVVQKT